jgi:hypothetical protein
VQTYSWIYQVAKPGTCSFFLQVVRKNFLLVYELLDEVGPAAAVVGSSVEAAKSDLLLLPGQCLAGSLAGSLPVSSLDCP